MLGEALLGDASATFLGHLAEPVGVPSLVRPTGGESNVLHASNLPLGGDHLRKLNQSCVSAKGRRSSLPPTYRFLLATVRSGRSGVLVSWTSVRVSSKDSASSSQAWGDAGSCPGVPFPHTGVLASVVVLQVLVLLVSERPCAHELISNPTSVGLICQPLVGVPDSEARIWVLDQRIWVNTVILQIFDCQTNPVLPDGWPKNPTVSRNWGEKEWKDDLDWNMTLLGPTPLLS